MISNKAAAYVLLLTRVQSKSDTKMNLYGLFKTEAAIVQATPQGLQTDLDGDAGTDLGILRWITEVSGGR